MPDHTESDPRDREIERLKQEMYARNRENALLAAANNDLRHASTLALQTLTFCGVLATTPEWMDRRDEAVKALREALKEPTR